jgi:hypothetical protein
MSFTSQEFFFIFMMSLHGQNKKKPWTLLSPTPSTLNLNLNLNLNLQPYTLNPVVGEREKVIQADARVPREPCAKLQV